MDNIIKAADGTKYLFASQYDFNIFRTCGKLNEYKIVDNCLIAGKKTVCRLVPEEQLKGLLEETHRKALDPERKMPSSGWRFEVFKDEAGFLQAEFTKKEWLRKNVCYVGVHFEIDSPFKYPGAESLVSYFQKGGLQEAFAPNVYYYYDRLFTKYNSAPVVHCIEEVPDLEDFLQKYMPWLYQELLQVATNTLLVNFDAEPYVQKIITMHYIYKT